jgi:hypothetical protein
MKSFVLPSVFTIRKSCHATNDFLPISLTGREPSSLYNYQDYNIALAYCIMLWEIVIKKLRRVWLLSVMSVATLWCAVIKWIFCPSNRCHSSQNKYQSSSLVLTEIQTMKYIAILRIMVLLCILVYIPGFVNVAVHLAFETSLTLEHHM